MYENGGVGLKKKERKKKKEEEEEEEEEEKEGKKKKKKRWSRFEEEGKKSVGVGLKKKEK